MELNLERADILQLEPISFTNTIKLLPVGKKGKQKLCIGDDSGTVSCFEFKKGEPQPVFTTRAFEGPITSLALGGLIQKRDKIFVSHDQKIVGLTKKGKDFFKLTHSFTEPFRNIAVEDTKIYTSCEYIFSSYDNGNDLSYFSSSDMINSLLVDNVTRESEYDVVLACQDNCLRVLQGPTCVLKIGTPGAVTAVSSINGDDVKFSRGSRNLIFGLSNGTLGLALVEPGGGSPSGGVVWTLEDSGRRSAITCLKLYDLTRDGLNEIIVGRDDGRIEVYSYDAGTTSSLPRLVFSKEIGETVKGIDCGLVNSTTHPEIVVAGFSGKIISFTTGITALH